MRPLPARMPDLDRRQVLRVPAQPFVRIDRNDYSIDPRSPVVGSSCVSPRRTSRASWLDTGELACRHRRVFAGG